MSECICKSGFGMNLSCPVHAAVPPAAAQPPADEIQDIPGMSGRDFDRASDAARAKRAAAQPGERARALGMSGAFTLDDLADLRDDLKVIVSVSDLRASLRGTPDHE